MRARPSGARTYFVVGRVEDLDLPAGSVDRAYVFELIEHLSLEEAKSALSRLRTLLRPGGEILVTTPNYRGPWTLVEWLADRSGLVAPMAGHQHVTRFSRRLLRQTLADSGFEVERVTTFSTFAPFVSVFGWKLAERTAAQEQRLALPFGNLIAAVGRRP